ncbi:RluA family pseudouridine synthase [Ruficoccus amylovorans]|uniref:RluA family pseudouridine synthase n=2 Tax=Ruficoccus amylovorans TaxID=1804625 RepID=A0A842HGW8_9BACT|nr:pseudouridine synthase [Ruficoccus amylovorans]MBC2594866.1 RluA family pseudouridine synthase [Ruficoccus amylovorans]
MSGEAELIDPAELREWIVFEDEDVLVIDKPGWIVCHPSKNGPWSSLVGACRELTGLETLHLVARLDRETSGIVLIAKRPASARRLQMAFQERRVNKEYLAIMSGELTELVTVNQPLAKDLESQVAARVTVRKSRSAQKAVTAFEPLASGGGYTLVRVHPETGRKHQIRAHAFWLGHPIAGDKIYGPDDTLFLEFITEGWTPRLDAALPMRRQALHATSLTFDGGPQFRLPLAWDMAQFAREVMGIDIDAYCAAPEVKKTAENYGFSS